MNQSPTWVTWLKQFPPPAGAGSQTITVVWYSEDGTEEIYTLTWNAVTEEYE